MSFTLMHSFGTMPSSTVTSAQVFGPQDGGVARKQIKLRSDLSWWYMSMTTIQSCSPLAHFRMASQTEPDSLDRNPPMFAPTGDCYHRNSKVCSCPSLLPRPILAPEAIFGILTKHSFEFLNGISSSARTFIKEDKMNRQIYNIFNDKLHKYFLSFEYFK